MQPVRHILFVTLSNIGDAILTTPALEALHRAYPDARIDLVGDARSEIIFRHCPYRGEIFLRHKKEGWAGLLRLIWQLRRRRYDLAVDLRTDGLLWLLRARQRVTKLPAHAGRNLHSAEKHFRAVALLTGGDIPPARIWLPASERSAAQTQLQAFRGRRILALAPGANWAPKIWPSRHFSALANRLPDHFDAVLLLGSTQDQPRAAQVAAGLQLPCLNLCGQTSLLQAAALLEQARCFVGNDSGLGHIASAVGTPTLTVFGPGEPDRYHPWGQHTAWLQSVSRDISDVSPEQAGDALLSLLENARCA